MHFLINYLIQQGHSETDLGIVLALPILITLFSLSRQIIGIRGLGLSAGILMTMILAISGLKYGLVLILASAILLTLLRVILHKWRLLYLPKISLILILTLTIIILFTALPFPFNQKTSLLSIGLILALAEKIILLQIEKKHREVFFSIIETLVLSVVGVSVILWPPLRVFALNRPDVIILACIIINIALGRWSGLRLNEYFRFHQVIKNIR